MFSAVLFLVAAAFGVIYLVGSKPAWGAVFFGLGIVSSAVVLRFGGPERMTKRLRYSGEEKENLLGPFVGQGGNAAIEKLRRKMDLQTAAPSQSIQAICSTCGRQLDRDTALESESRLSAPERALKLHSGGLFLGTVCESCGNVECYSCRGGVGLPCSRCGGTASPAYAKLFSE